MPRSATERFARTYTPRVPDDSYDSLFGALDTLVPAPAQTDQQVIVATGFSSGGLGSTILFAGATAGVQVGANFVNGQLIETLIGAPIQHDSLVLSVTMAGGTLH